MNKTISLALLATLSLLTSGAQAKNISLQNIEYRGPFEVKNPWITDSLDVNNNSYGQTSAIEKPINFRLVKAEKGDTIMMLGGETDQVHQILIPVSNKHFSTLDLNIAGVKNYKMFVDDKPQSGPIKLKPGTHTINLQVLTKGGEKDTLRINASSPQAVHFINRPSSGKRAYKIEDVIYMPKFNGVQASPSGKYAIIGTNQPNPGGSGITRNRLINLKDGKTMSSLSEQASWMDGKDILWQPKIESDGSVSIVTIDPVSLEETVWAENVPEGNFMISPNANYLIYFTTQEGPKEDPDIYRIINPEDRQPGYRTRSGLALYDLKTGLYRPLTFGHKNVSLQDISPDASKLLVMDMRNRFEKRPTSVFSLYELDLNTMKADTLVWEDGFINGASYSPDGSRILISGSPEALNGIGKNVPEGRIPSMTDIQLFILDKNTGKVDAITKDFNPSVGEFIWHKPSGNIYFVAEDKDMQNLFEYNPKTGKFSLIDVPEDMILRFSMAEDGMAGAVIGESAVNPEVLYSLDWVKGKPTVRRLESPAQKLISGVELATVEGWDFVNSVGDTINGRFYLPADFDPNKKYPMIVNYYGGCSPTGRNFATRYPHHLYANQGYVVYVINPSGATGFGQEFSSRHVNTAGEGVARDIIEGTKKFVEEHPYVDKDKIGCIGASYGGFMTQYLQTVTDLFAAAISHAGISDHTSYWGNGYWGYSYSEVSMADSYPWKDKELFVNQSPLYNADKINTPLLFLHGDGDTNVPPMESVQLFTALKLLGKDTALVEVTDQNHHILEPGKRIKWQDTIFAWFAKYLQDDPGWWEELYPSHSL